jgi:uncharacterized OsmC-like protein
MAEQKKVNDVNVDQLREAMDGLRENPDLGKYQFRVHNEWISGAHCRSSISDFLAGGEEGTHEHVHVLECDEPAGLLGTDRGPSATETLLHALAACLSGSFIYHAANQGVYVEELKIEVEGDLDLGGFLGIDEAIPSNFQQIRVKFIVKADASEEKISELCEYAQRRSPVFNSVTRPIPVDVSIESERVTAAAHAHR